jgi:hypothetical protein
MKIDESKSDATHAMCQEDRQNRREFFHGLGKWSMIVVAAVSFLRGSATGSQASHGDTPRPELEPQRPAWAAPDEGNQRLAVKPYSKYFKGYDKFYSRQAHSNHRIIE